MLHGKASTMHCRAFAAHVQTTAPFGKARPARRPILRRAAEPSPQEAAEMQKAMQAAMKDPQVASKMSALQEAMKDPAMQQQMAEMQSAMQNKGLQDRMAALKDDPELAPMFEDIQRNGMQAMMKYWNDPKVLAKIGERMGDISMGDIPTSAPAEGAAAAAAAPAAAAQAPAPEINDLRDAAKYGDLEAVEDFIAVGKDVNESDEDGRTALHYAVAYNHADIAAELISSGASLEAQDSKQNTVLHYACGYGRSELVRLLLERGAQSASENTSGQTPLELVTSEPRNPINKDTETLTLLEHAVTSSLQS